MLKQLLIGLFAFCSIATFAQDKVLGTWKTIDDNTGKARSYIKLFVNEKDNKMYGQVTKIVDPKKQDRKCDKCKGSRKDQPILGIILVEAMEKDGDEWSNGYITDPDNGKRYKCKMWVEEGKLQVRGYLGVFYRTQVWLPVEGE